MKFLITDNALKNEWDHFVASQECGHFMQSWAWGKFKSLSGWMPTYLVATEDDEIKSTALVLSKRIPYTKKKIYYLPRGPVTASMDEDALSFILNNIKQHVQKNNGVFLRVDPYIEESKTYDKAFEAAGYRKINKKWSDWNCPKFVFWLDIRKGSDYILSGMKKKKRYEIRSAYKKGVEIIQGSEENLQDFHELMIETASRKNIGSHDFKYYENILTTLGDSLKIQLFLAKHQGETAAAGISMIYGKKSWLLYLASSEKHFHLNSNRALQFEMIKWATEFGCERYDFRGTATDDPPNPSDSGYGVYKFKKSFNPDFIRTVGYYDYVTKTLYYSAFRVFEDHLLSYIARVTGKMIRFRDKLLNG